MLEDGGCRSRGDLGGHRALLHDRAQHVAAARLLRRAGPRGQGAVSIPVSAVGRINTPELAEQILAAGDADMISMGRPLISDPDLPNKARDGERDDIIVCIGCNKGCHDPGRVDRATACLLNAETGFELELHLEPAARCARRCW
jgi:2,4-dienoyl-CoA reductase (NADPH2)